MALGLSAPPYVIPSPPTLSSPLLLDACCSVLTGCGLTGSLPSTWFSSGAFPSLQSLELGTNAFTGSLPPLVPSSLPRLARLDCSDNRLTGTLPSSWAGAMIEKM